ncbi:MAG: hypothetical protein J0L97_03795 [Alphaproteobacteria bacterium]|nr:hypothetical protein [Alphaproteobacteria bacterium]
MPDLDLQAEARLRNALNTAYELKNYSKTMVDEIGAYFPDMGKDIALLRNVMTIQYDVLTDRAATITYDQANGAAQVINHMRNKIMVDACAGSPDFQDAYRAYRQNRDPSQSGVLIQAMKDVAPEGVPVAAILDAQELLHNDYLQEFRTVINWQHDYPEYKDAISLVVADVLGDDIARQLADPAKHKALEEQSAIIREALGPMAPFPDAAALQSEPRGPATSERDPRVYDAFQQLQPNVIGILLGATNEQRYEALQDLNYACRVIESHMGHQDLANEYIIDAAAKALGVSIPNGKRAGEVKAEVAGRLDEAIGRISMPEPERVHTERPLDLDKMENIIHLAEGIVAGAADRRSRAQLAGIITQSYGIYEDPQSRDSLRSTKNAMGKLEEDLTKAGASMEELGTVRQAISQMLAKDTARA